MNQTLTVGTRPAERFGPGLSTPTAATAPAATRVPGTVLVIDADARGTRVRVIGRQDQLLFTRDLGPLPEEHTRFCDLLSGLRGRFAVDAVGHRFLTVPGHRGAVLVDDRIARQLADPAELGPRYVTPPSYGLVLARTQFDCPHLACSDTTFYDDLPDERTSYPLPAGWQARYGLRRRGFHGLSHEHAVRRAARLLGDAATTRLISCHLGPTSSVTAVRAGVAVDTTSGFVPGDALPGATCATMDAGAVLHLVADDLVPAVTLRHLLAENAGLRAMAGGDRSFAGLVADAEAGDAGARRAVETHQHRLAAAVAGLTASLGGLDALVFTGPLGCREPWVRRDLVRRLAYLGVRIDPDRNQRADGDAVLSRRTDPVRVVTVEPRPDLRIAAAARGRLVATPTGQLRRPRFVA